MNNKPDNLEKGIRFGCGGLIGMFIGLYLGLNFLFEDNIIVFILTDAILIVVCGFMAMKQGDRFWLSLKNWLKLF